MGNKMGVAAYNRASQVVSARIREGNDTKQEWEQLALAQAVAEECNTFTTAAMAYLVEPRGLREKTILWARQRRGWQKRHAAVGNAHNAWVNDGHLSTAKFYELSVARAKAVHNLFVFALGTWTIPDHIKVPRAVL
jgi:hypothetical protein